MITKLFTVFDQKAMTYLPPFTGHNKAVGERSFSDAVNQPGHAFNMHPMDYTLIILGDFDDQSGRVIPLDIPLNVGSGVQYVKGDTPPLPKSMINDLNGKDAG